MEKLEILASNICDYSLNLQKGDNVYISYDSINCNPLIKHLVEKISNKGCFVYTELNDKELDAYRKSLMNDSSLSNLKYLEEAKINYFDAFIYIKYNINDYESKIIANDKKVKLSNALAHSIDIRANEKKWVLLNYPSYLDAYKAGMNSFEFYNFALEAMTIDYKDLANKLKPLKMLMENTDKVRITSPNTDITFSIKGMPTIACCGEKNIPDGELYTAPLKDSVNGVITYNTPSPYMGCVYHNVSLTFKNGKIIKASSNEDANLLKTIFNIDEGAKYVGEFSIGFNPVIRKAMGDILFDEKIYGSIHFTPGSSYDDANNDNKSSVHWDLVLIQTSEYGGGEIYFDDKLIRKDGKFVPISLQQLN